MHRPNFWPKGLFGAPRRARGAPFAVDRLRGLPRGRDGAGAAGGGVRAPCDTAPKMSALRCYPPYTFFELQLGKVYLQTPAAILPAEAPATLGHLLPDALLAAKRRMVRVVTRMPRWLKLQPVVDVTTRYANAIRIHPSPDTHSHHTAVPRTRRRPPAFPRRALRLGVAKRAAAMHSPSRASFFASAAAQPATALRLVFPRANVAAELSQKRRAHALDDGTHTLSRAAAITDSRRGLHSARALRRASDRKGRFCPRISLSIVGSDPGRTRAGVCGPACSFAQLLRRRLRPLLLCQHP